MAIYHFSGQVLSKYNRETGKPRSPLASAAYRSGDKLTDESNGLTFFYKREVEPVAHILAPDHAPSWVYERERLWNEVNTIEKNINSQFAREFNIALPVELSHEEQEQLALEFCQEAFVEKGMVADIAIHRDDENNPHFHVMCTVRPFEENGSWGFKGRREYLKDENGEFIKDKNGKRAFRKINSTDWGDKEVFNQWRKLWSDKANSFLGKAGIDERISHLSNEDRGLETIPQIHEGYVARKMESEGKKSDRVEYNRQVKKYNSKVAELNVYKKKKQNIQYQNKFVRKLSPAEKKELAKVAKQLKMFVNFESLNTRRQQLQKWEKKVTFNKFENDKERKLSTISDQKEAISQALEILERESDRFIKTNYPHLDCTKMSQDVKITLTDRSIDLGRLLAADEIDDLLNDRKIDLLNEQITNVLENRFTFVMAADKELSKMIGVKNLLEKRLGINSESPINKIKEAAFHNPTDYELLKKTIIALEKLDHSKQMITELYDLEIRKHYPDIKRPLTLEQKEILLVGLEYFGEPIQLDKPIDKFRYSTIEQRRILEIFSSVSPYVVRNDLKKRFPDFKVDNPRFIVFFKDECLRNIDNLSEEDIKILQKIDPERIAENEFSKTEFVRSTNYEINRLLNNEYEGHNHSAGLNPSGVITGTFNQMFEEAMRDRSFDSKRQFEEDLKSKSKKMRRGRSGPSL
ncbi:MobQ family relaxase [Bacillus stratosphericus]|uniref:MobQ family relaxase n=1 Tax=Bacillus stratosphericus TaxID=293386 RepID=UPI001CFB114F|nr:MobQ family relaxase [Bacillus stratosphericus]